MDILDTIKKGKCEKYSYICEALKRVLRLIEVLKDKAKENQGKRTDLLTNWSESVKPINIRQEVAKIAGVSHDNIMVRLHDCFYI
jgi:hypothetical protein